jgi:hypothetical protein
MTNLKHFIKEEFTCDSINCFDKMNPKLLKMLDDARSIADTPFTITSSWRSKKHNAEVGGKPNSAHLRGTAIDVVCMSSHQRIVMVDAFIMAGFNRIGIAKTFIHADCDKELPQDVMWLY